MNGTRICGRKLKSSMLRIIFAGNKQRGITCLEAVNKYHDIVGVVGNKKVNGKNNFIEKARELELPILNPKNINDSKFIDILKPLKPDLTILAGYGSIVKKEFIAIAKYGCINLHGGKLPKYRGSSPMNWALINGEKKFTITIIKVDKGVDTGDILLEKTFKIDNKHTIADLHDIANANFPDMLIDVISQIQNGKFKSIVQNNNQSSYYPLRFPDDGLIFFDQYKANEIHNRIRALTSPYPGVSCYYHKKQVVILKSKLPRRSFFGEPGRIYRVTKNKGILVCAKDKCLWLEKVIDKKTKLDITKDFVKYEKLGTIHQAALRFYDN